MTGCPHSDQPRVLLQGTLHDDPVLWKHQQTLPEKKIHTEPTSEREDVMRGGRSRRRLSRQESCGVLADLFSGKEKCWDWDRDGEISVWLKNERRRSRWRTRKEGQHLLSAVCGALAECFSASTLRAQPAGKCTQWHTHGPDASADKCHIVLWVRPHRWHEYCQYHIYIWNRNLGSLQSPNLMESLKYFLKSVQRWVFSYISHIENIFFSWQLSLLLAKHIYNHISWKDLEKSGEET